MAARYYVTTALPAVLADPLGSTGNPVVTALPGTWPAQYPFPVLIDWGTSTQEAILVTGAPTGTAPAITLPCTRAVDGTTAQSHASGATVIHGTTSYEPVLLQSRTYSPTLQTGAYAASPSDYVEASLSGGSWTLTLPNAPAAGTIVGAKIVANAAGDVNALTIACSGSDVFNISGGATTHTLTLVDQAVELQYNSGIWLIAATDDAATSLAEIRQGTWYLDQFTGTDDQKMASALSAVTASGGTIRLAARTHTFTQQIVTHYTGHTPISVSVIGCGGTNVGVDLETPAGPTIVDISGISGSLASKMLFKHFGTIELAGFLLRDASVQAPMIPMVQVTGSRPYFHDLAVQGNNTGHSPATTTSWQDVFYIGGNTTTVGTDGDQDGYHGYCGTIERVSFNGIRRGFWLRCYANSVNIRNCEWAYDCGSGTAFSVTDAAITAATATLTSATANFTSAMVGLPVVITGAQEPYVNAGYFVSYIASVQSSTSCTLNNNAVVTVTGATAVCTAGAAFTVGILGVGGGNESQYNMIHDLCVEVTNYVVGAEVCGDYTIKNYLGQVALWDSGAPTLFGAVCYGTVAEFNYLDFFGGPSMTTANSLVEQSPLSNTLTTQAGTGDFWVTSGARFGPAYNQVLVGSGGGVNGVVQATGTNAAGVNLALAGTSGTSSAAVLVLSKLSCHGAPALNSVAAGAGAGSGASASASGGTDNRGTITVTTGTGPSAGVLAVVTFSASWSFAGGAPTVAVSPYGATTAAAQAAAGLQPAVSAVSNTGFSLACAGTPSASTTYTFTYIVLG